MKLFLLIAVSVLIIFIVLIILLRRNKQKGPKKTSYIDALHMILDGKKDEALENLKRAVKEDTENIMAYIKLGDIYRDKGYPIRAVKIHRNLLIRSELDNKQIETILHHLIIDYQAAGALDKAIEMAERLVHRTKKNVDNQLLLLSLYEEKGDWDKALIYRQSTNKWMKKKDQKILALYKVQSGLKFVEKKAEHESRIRFREATKLDKKCAPAYLYWGDSYRREERNADALRIWKDFTTKNPDYAHLAFDRLKEVLFDLGRYGDMEEIYQQIIQKKPKNPTAYIHLAELYRKQGNLDEALTVCSTMANQHPDSLRCRTILIQVLQQQNKEKEALTEALKILNHEIEKGVTFRCDHCGFRSENPLWHCPQCHHWSTFLEEAR